LVVTNPSNLRDHHSVLVLDASVALNLLGTGQAARLLQALGRKVVMDEHAIKEIIFDPSNGASGEHAIAALAAADLIKRHRLTTNAYDLFLELTGATPPDDLGDGEAATIATATHAQAIPVIDERKARRIVSTRTPGAAALHTIDLLACPAVVNAFAQELGDIVYCALRHARMRVPDNCRPWVLSVVGKERAKECPSLNATLHKPR
jgi:predicted nucleic acid-binding protein